ncbi:Transcriptional regulator WhiB [Streptomyces tendae]
MDWRHRAVFREEDPELFFPIGNTGPALLQIEEAKAVCRRCPVMEQCLQWRSSPARTPASGVVSARTSAAQ